MPSRLLSIGSHDSDVVRLKEIAGFSEPYVALSHCWGRDSTKVPMTKSGTYEARTREIPWEELSRTFQDAIRFSRMIGFRFIWIDSLCIIQDSQEDWESELIKMGSIYCEAILVLSATAAEDGRIGLFPERDRIFPIQSMQKEYDHESEHLSFQAPSQTLHFNIGINSIRQSPGNTWPLFKVSRRHLSEATETEREQRGWALQERLLATRVAHFTAIEVIWECNEQAACECGYLDTMLELDDSLKSLYDKVLMNATKRMNSADYWCQLVETYSERQLTEESDKFPAISGMARQFHDIDMGDYVAGIWSRYAVKMLLWFPHRGRLGARHTRAEFYTAPSWSWASVIGKIDWDFGYFRFEEMPEVVAEVHNIKCEYSTKDDFGKLSGGKLKISCPSLTCKVRIEAKGLEVLKLDGQSLLLLDDNTRLEVQDGQEVECLFFHKIDGNYSRQAGMVPGLVITESKSDKANEKVYKRVGRVIITQPGSPESMLLLLGIRQPSPKALKALPELRKMTFTIV
jgi:hypothetical protein